MISEVRDQARPFQLKREMRRCWSLAERRNRADLIEVFKSIGDLSGIDFLSLYEMSSMIDLRGPSGHLDVTTYRMPDRCSSLPENIVESSSLNSFKRGLQKLYESKVVSLWTKKYNQATTASSGRPTRNSYSGLTAGVFTGLVT